jgi:hypothetical protein
MDFAPEPVLDAFTPPPTRSAPRAAAADDNGQSFDDHLDAVSEPALERPAPSQNEAKDEAPPVESKPVRSEEAHDEPIDPDVALLGGPVPPALPPMAAPVVVQIAASLPQQTQAEPQSGDAEIAPLSAPQAPPPVDAQAAAEPAAPTEKSAKTEAKPAAPDVAQSPSTPPSQSAPANAQSVQNIAQPRLGGSDMARRETQREGQIPRHTLRADIDYANVEALTTFSKVGIKVWVYKGEILPKPKEEPIGAYVTP